METSHSILLQQWDRPPRSEWPPTDKFGAVYLYHIYGAGLHHARHYQGFVEGNTKPLQQLALRKRDKLHRGSRGAKLLRAVNQAGLDYAMVCIWWNVPQSEERRMKNWHKISRLCPICNPNAGRKRSANKRAARAARAPEYHHPQPSSSSIQ